MATNFHQHHGVVHGNMIRLDEEIGLPDGQEVSVTLRPVETSESRLAAGESLRRAFGGWAEDADELNEYLDWNRRRRKMSRAETDP